MVVYLYFLLCFLCDISRIIFCSENGRLLRQIGDDLDSNEELNNMISSIKVTADNVMEIFGSLITETFRDGTINWGRIVTLMFVGYKLAVKVLFEGDVLKMIIKGVVEYIGKKLVHWIVNCGGWVSVVFDSKIKW